MRTRAVVLAVSLLLWSVPAWAMKLNFDKVDDSLSCGTGASINNLTTVTYFAVFNATDEGEGNAGRLFDKGFGSINMGLTKRIEFARCFGVGCATETDRVTADNAVTTGTPHTLVVTYDGTDHTGVHIYIDGSEASYNAAGDSDGMLSITDDSGNAQFIGNNGADGSRTWNGTLSEAAIWNVVIGAASITQLQSKMKGIARQVEPANLVAYWGFEEKGASVSADGVTIYDPVNANNCTGADGANNTGLTYSGDNFLNYPARIP